MSVLVSMSRCDGRNSCFPDRLGERRSCSDCLHRLEPLGPRGLGSKPAPREPALASRVRGHGRAHQPGPDDRDVVGRLVHAYSVAPLSVAPLRAASAWMSWRFTWSQSRLAKNAST